MIPHSAFTLKPPGLVNQLVTSVHVSIPNTETSYQVNAIWDTGATGSVITEKIVKELDLKPTGMSTVNTANGLTQQYTYIVDIVLPNGIQVTDVTVTGAIGLTAHCDVLIGMDIISLGDFSITHYKGNTCMSFRIPSLHEIDYVKSIDFKHKPNIPAGQKGSNITKPKKKR